MRSNLLRLTVVSLVALVAMLLTGCADQEARSNAAEARKTADTLSGEVTKLQTEVSQLKEQVAGMRGALEQKINDQMGAISTSVTGIESNLRKEFTDQSTKNGESIRKLLGDADARVESRLKSFQTQEIAEDLAKLRKQIEDNRKELIGFMDLQLKELYPYAYQPKRLENPVPPTPPSP